MSFTHALELVLARAGIAIGVAMAGAVIAVIVGGVSHRAQCALISLSAGVLLGVSIFSIFPETAEMIGTPTAIGAMVTGVFVFLLISRYLYIYCPACSATAIDPAHGFVQLGWLLVSAGTLHALSDGIALTIGAEVSQRLGMLVLGAVAVHKLPEGAALAAIAMQAGYRPRAALLITFAMQCMTAVGSAVGLLSAAIPEAAVGAALGVAGGSFLYIGGFALYAESKEHERRSIIGWAAVGFVILAGLSYTVPG